MDAAGQQPRQIPGLQVAILFQKRPQGVHPFQRGGVFLLPADLLPPAVEAEGVMGVVDDPAEAAALGRKGIVDRVDGLGQRGQAFGHGFQPGGGGGKPGRRLRGRFLRHRSEPAPGQKGRKGQSRRRMEQQGERRGRSRNTEDPQHTAAPAGSQRFQPPPGGQQDRGGGAAAKPHCCGGQCGVCGAEGRPGEGGQGQGGLFLSAAAENGIGCPAEEDAGAERADPDPAQCGGQCRSRHQGAEAGLLGREAPQGIAQTPGQQGVCPAEEQQGGPAPAGAKGKTDSAKQQRPAAAQQSRAELSGPEPPGRHGSTHGTEQTETVQRQGSEPMQQDAQRGPGGPSRKAVLRKPQSQSQPEGEKGTVEDGPASGKPQPERGPLPQRGADRGPRCKGRASRLSRAESGSFRHKKDPRFPAGITLVWFCFPRLLHIL